LTTVCGMGGDIRLIRY